MNINSLNPNFKVNSKTKHTPTRGIAKPTPSSTPESGPQGIQGPASLDREPASVQSQPAQSRQVTQAQSQIASNVLGTDKTNKKKEFDDVWTDWRDPKVEPTDLAGLKESISPERYNESPQLKKLVESLELGNGKHARLGDLGAMFKRIGPENSEKVLQTLNQYLAKGPVEDRAELVGNIIHDLALPSDIDQEYKGTCAATAIQTILAIEQPQRYATMATRLADGQTVKLPNGQTLRPNNVWRYDTKDRRSQSAKVLQNALMKYGNGDYNSAKDYEIPGKDGKKDQESPEDGLSRSQQHKLGRDILGYDNYKHWDSKFHSQEKMLQMVEDEIAHGRPAVISLPRHAVTVVGIDKSGDQHKVIINSWGKQFSMTTAEFKTYVRGVRYRDDSGWDNQKTPSGERTILGD